jgi:hypothetical protein
MNKYLGLLIMALYFGNYHLSMFFSFGNNDLYWDINTSIYCLIVLLAVEYKKQNLLIEKVFLAVIFNNIYVLLFKNEYDYTINDIYFILFFTAIQYAKQLYRNYSEYIRRNLAIYFNIKKSK